MFIRRLEGLQREKALLVPRFQILLFRVETTATEPTSGDESLCLGPNTISNISADAISGWCNLQSREPLLIS